MIYLLFCIGKGMRQGLDEKKRMPFMVLEVVKSIVLEIGNCTM